MTEMSTLEKVRRLKARRPQNIGSRMRGIFHQWHDADNVIRLAGQFVEVRTHFVAPAPKRQDRGLCRPDAFKGDNSIPQVVNCPDWDTAKEEAKPDKTCPLCKLAVIARAILKDTTITAEEKKFFDALRQAASAKANLKWNIIDRDDPTILLVDEQGNEKKVLGYKIANIGMEAWNDIEGIFEQCGFDISDPVKGVDIKVIKGHNGKRVVYSAQKVLDALHEDLRDLYEANLDTEPTEEASSVSAEVDEKVVIQEALEQESVAALEEVSDGDGLMSPAQEPAAVTPTTAPQPAAPAPKPVVPVAKPAAPAPKPVIPVAKPAAPAPQPVAPASRPAAPKAAVPASKPITTAPLRRPVMVPGTAQKKRT
jgi:hypothetical protein